MFLPRERWGRIATIDAPGMEYSLVREPRRGAVSQNRPEDNPFTARSCLPTEVAVVAEGQQVFIHPCHQMPLQKAIRTVTVNNGWRYHVLPNWLEDIRYEVHN